MAVQANSEPRIPLSRDRVLRAAVAIADSDGLESVTMRRIGEALSAEAMSLYYHVANKNDLFDGIVDVLMAELNESVDRDDGQPGDWKAAMRRRILTARQIMLRHPWAPRLLETRTTMRPAVVLYHDRLVGLMRSGGFSYDLAHHALHALGSRALGFSQELFDPSAGAGDQSERMLADLADQLPNLVGMLSEIAHDDPESTLGWCDDQAEFEFSLDLILDGLDRLK
ncbi:TetR/AcrR family transcriptional regulator [Kribbella pittospori]|uniref:TetR/AcrR family transcriptional regulator n=1 Tax=Kribbella pittospori TaxID=722689 RepID=UPI00192D69F2|nr:TetR/AcrR family transcriptional regulator [Kribbella pittospori]